VFLSATSAGIKPGASSKRRPLHFAAGLSYSLNRRGFIVATAAAALAPRIVVAQTASPAISGPFKVSPLPFPTNAVDLIRMARTFTKLDALEAEIEAVEKTDPATRH
jgi:hypothetical protein